MGKKPIQTILAVGLIMTQTAILRADWITHVYGPHVEAALLDTADVQESSGLIASRTSPNVFWTHNDSGGTPRVWALRLNAADMIAHVAKKLGYVNLPSATNIDWEDIATGPGPSIYIFDGGDNPPCDLTNKRIHRFLEPTIDPNGPTVILTPAFESIRFEYPDSVNPLLPADANDERYDCETLMVHPTTGDIYLVTKRSNANAATARVYKLLASSLIWDNATVHVLQFVANISTSVPSTPTGGDIDTFGRRVLIRNYGTAYEFTLPIGQPFDNIFSQVPRTISLSGSIQGEGICFAADGSNVFATSEVIGSFGPQTCPIYIVPWQLANARAEAIGNNQASIRWDTASTDVSTVNYGTTTSYGSTVNNPAAVTAHDVLLTSLLPQTQYYYRVKSGSLSYPEPAGAAGVYFTTLAGHPGDFDLDTDVDQSDFGYFQVCMSGHQPGIPVGPACTFASMDGDDDMDNNDFTLFFLCWSGPNVPSDPNCVN